MLQLRIDTNTILTAVDPQLYVFPLVPSFHRFYFADPIEDLLKCRGFHQALEGFCGRPGVNSTSLYMHNKVHNMVAGSFCCAATAANDPIFILHHSQIDRILQVIVPPFIVHPVFTRMLLSLRNNH